MAACILQLRVACFCPLPTRPPPDRPAPAVCQYLGACLDPPCVVMEYCAKRSVDTLLSAGLTDAKVGLGSEWRAGWLAGWVVGWVGGWVGEMAPSL